MDDRKRETYDLFGVRGLEFDPRNDELQLLMGLVGAYLSWWVILYIVTVPRPARSCRWWAQFVLLVMMAGEVSLYLMDIRLPFKDVLFMTEHQFLVTLHSMFPFLLAMLFCYSESVYVDMERGVTAFVEGTLRNQKVWQLMWQCDLFGEKYSNLLMSLWWLRDLVSCLIMNVLNLMHGYLAGPADSPGLDKRPLSLCVISRINRHRQMCSGCLNQ